MHVHVHMLIICSSFVSIYIYSSCYSWFDRVLFDVLHLDSELKICTVQKVFDPDVCHTLSMDLHP